MDKIAIQLEETHGIARIDEPLGVGIPLPTGAVQTASNLALMDGASPLSVQLTPLAHWSDGSLRWVHASFLANIPAESKKVLLLTRQKAPASGNAQSAVTQTAQGHIVQTTAGTVTLQPGSLAWVINDHEGASIPSAVTLADSTGAPCFTKADSHWKLSHQGPVFVAATLSGQWLTQSSEPLARFQCELRIYLATGLIQVELTTHNPKRARHPGGLWDLGDPGSVYFRELAIETTLPDAERACAQSDITPQITAKHPGVFEVPDFTLYQDSSGGKNWQSRNHLQANGEISTQFCGYKLSTSSEVLLEGKRANPLLAIQHNNNQLSVAIPGFWQNFPTSLRKTGNKLTIGLFPKEAKAPYELQGGEQKTLRYLLAPGTNSNSLGATAYTPLVPTLAPEHYQQTNAFPWFKAEYQPGTLDELIASGLNGPSNFFAKREVIDEFGWRNFGDIFADHETLYQKEGEPLFITHYNNQYDAIYGFARQFALTGDSRWYELMDDLARHAADIDIYHTNEDRAEYNNGLFWHTDHYLDAHTATHRTFSRHNDTSSTPGQTGGGPAAEHCYTTGLLYHYFMTGSAISKTAVLKLTNWMVATHEGTGGFLESLLAIKNQDLPKIKALARGQSPTAHRYPFTRGTGNYLTALMDAAILEPNKDWLSKAGGVIRETMHPNDDIAGRNLLVIETGWSYLVLLSAVARYLSEKRALDQIDDTYHYAASCFMEYANWIRQNEQPFLKNSIHLEFANHTWVAQDIRKAMLMFQAAELAPKEQASRFMASGESWLTETCNTLITSKERDFSRILIILLQGYGPHTSARPSLHALTPRTLHATTPSPQLTWALLFLRVVQRLGNGIYGLNPAREKIWLDTRLNRP